MSMAASYANSVATGGPATLKTLGVALSMLLFLLSYVFSIHFMVLTLIFWIAVAIPMFVIYGISGLLVIAEFAVRRIAEYPKGPILAISALVFAVGALLKALS